jgi:hypothetical protein
MSKADLLEYAVKYKLLTELQANMLLENDELYQAWLISSDTGNCKVN